MCKYFIFGEHLLVPWLVWRHGGFHRKCIFPNILKIKVKVETKKNMLHLYPTKLKFHITLPLIHLKYSKSSCRSSIPRLFNSSWTALSAHPHFLKISIFQLVLKVEFSLSHSHRTCNVAAVNGKDESWGSDHCNSGSLLINKTRKMILWAGGCWLYKPGNHASIFRQTIKNAHFTWIIKRNQLYLSQFHW